MASSGQRVNYDLIAHLYDEPDRDYDPDPDLLSFLERRPSPRLRVLDMGCGTGKQLSADHTKYPGLQLVGLDLFHGMLRQAQRRCTGIGWAQGNNTRPPFREHSFDYITNQFSYHHVRDKVELLTEIFRILKPGGRFVITNLDPWSMVGWIVYRYFPASWQRDIADFLPADELVSRMEKTGFRDIQVRRRKNQTEENLKEFLCYASQRFRTSQLIAIPDSEYEAGIARLQEEVANLGGDVCVPSELCLIWVTGDKPGKKRP